MRTSKLSDGALRENFLVCSVTRKDVTLASCGGRKEGARRRSRSSSSSKRNCILRSRRYYQLRDFSPHLGALRIVPAFGSARVAGCVTCRAKGKLEFEPPRAKTRDPACTIRVAQNGGAISPVLLGTSLEARFINAETARARARAPGYIF